MGAKTQHLYISPPDQRPHHIWYVSGVLGCALAETLDQAIRRYYEQGNSYSAETLTNY
jgi:hypothetical protein